MRITILGRGPLADPLAELAERVGNTVRRVQDAAAKSGADDAPDLVILAGSSTAIEPLLASVASSIPEGTALIDATIPTQQEGRGEEEQALSGTEWIAATVPHARIVRAFASIPAEALGAVLRPTSDQPARLAVPLAGDDRDAKAVVETFMRAIGVDPFDLGALRSAEVINPRGALWGKALSQVEMLEAVGWLSGDG
jgi:predicted dinucleotide-binding enzyme